MEKMPYLGMHFVSLVCFQFLLLLLLLRNADCGSLVKTLPGYDGELPFTLETGYIGVEDSELFYLFVESTGNPRTDPLLIYLVGGPGCSALNAFFLQVGPLEFNTTNYNGGTPQLVLRPYPWTKTASIIFIDAPVGTGYSYCTTSDVNMTDTRSARQIYQFILKWLGEHPIYIPNRFFVASDSYSGLVAPIVATNILNGNEAGERPYIELIGIISGSVHTSTQLEENIKYLQAYRLALLSDGLFRFANESCDGSFSDVNSTNILCEEAIQKIEQCLNDIYDLGVLEPNCETISPKPDNPEFRRALKEDGRGSLHSSSFWCKNFVYALSSIWANNVTVQEALHVREGTFEKWYRCSFSVNSTYDHDITDAFDYQKNLTTTGLQILLYDGDHDLVVPHISTESWLKALNISVSDTWRPWFSNNQVAGYQIQYSNDGYRVTYATLKGSGHSPTEYKNKECFDMFERWIHFYPL